MIRTILILVFLISPFPVYAIHADEPLTDPVLEQRAQDLFKTLRCVVCTSESIHDSRTKIASSLRLAVRKRLVSGDSDKEVLTYITDRYGDEVLMRPPLKQNTYILWFGPALLLLIGVFMMTQFIQKTNHE